MNANDKKALNRITKQAAKVTHSELTSMYVCIYLFTRHGYTKVYSDNENNCEFG